MRIILVLLLISLEVNSQNYLKCFDFSKQKPVKKEKVFSIRENKEDREDTRKDIEHIVGVSLLYSNDHQNKTFFGQRITILNRKLPYFDRLLTIGYYQNKDRISFIPVLFGIRKELFNTFYVGFNIGANLSYGKPIGSVVSPNIGVSKNRFMLDVAHLNATHTGNKPEYHNGIKYSSKVVTLYYKL